jgi:hypothetical protein
MRSLLRIKPIATRFMNSAVHVITKCWGKPIKFLFTHDMSPIFTKTKWARLSITWGRTIFMCIQILIDAATFTWHILFQVSITKTYSSPTIYPDKSSCKGLKYFMWIITCVISHLLCSLLTPPPSIKVMNVWNHTFTPPYTLMTWYL